jgi:hypothetical protein
MPNLGRRRWRVKDTVFSAWRELPGSHTPGEVWKMRGEGRFAMAQSLEDSGEDSTLRAQQPDPERSTTRKDRG